MLGRGSNPTYSILRVQKKSGNFRTIEEAAKARALAEERYFASVIDKFQKDKAEN